MLLINGKPVEDDFLVKYAQVKKKSLSDFTPKKTEAFKLQDSFFRRVRQREMKSGKMQDRVLVSPEFSIDATYQWYSPFTGMQVNLTYTKNYQPDNNGVNRSPINQVSFEYGIVTVDKEESDLYFWLLNHPLNQTNPKYLEDENQRPPKPFLFRQLLPDREANVFIDHEKTVSKVILMITDPTMKQYINDEALKHLAKSYGYGSVLNSGRKDLEKFVIGFAKKHPQKVLDDLTSAATEIRAVLADAEQYGVIKFDFPYVKWVDLSKGKRTVNNGIIVQCPSGLDPMDFFVNWMREKDNSGVYNQLKKELDDKKLAEYEAAQVASN